MQMRMARSSLDAHHRYANFIDLSDSFAFHLRAVTGNLDVVGGETLGGFNAAYVPESEIALHEELSTEQKAKQLGFDDHPVYTYRVAEMLKEPTERCGVTPTQTL